MSFRCCSLPRIAHRTSSFACASHTGSARLVSKASRCAISPLRLRLLDLCVHPARKSLRACASQGMKEVSQAEKEANDKRWKESGNGVGSADKWRWTLNWDDITPDIVVGSCPRSPSDLDRMVDEAKAGAVLCLQSDLCMEAMKIDWEAIRARAGERGVLMTRVAVRDFDHNDQALMLPEAVRMLQLLLALNKRVYVHCTAGINRATLTVVAYLTFVQGMKLDDAHAKVKQARPQAHPYIDCWKTVRKRLVESRGEEVGALARALYAGRQRPEGPEGAGGDDFADWLAAEEQLIQQLFQRQLGCSLSLITAMQATTAGAQQAAGPSIDQQAALKAELSAVSIARQDTLQSELAAEQRRRREVESELDLAKQEIASLRQCYESTPEDGAGSCAVAEMDHAREEIASLRTAIEVVAAETRSMLEGVGSASSANGRGSDPLMGRAAPGTASRNGAHASKLTQ